MHSRLGGGPALPKALDFRTLREEEEEEALLHGITCHPPGCCRIRRADQVVWDCSHTHTHTQPTAAACQESVGGRQSETPDRYFIVLSKPNPDDVTLRISAAPHLICVVTVSEIPPGVYSSLEWPNRPQPNQSL